MELLSDLLDFNFSIFKLTKKNFFSLIFFHQVENYLLGLELILLNLFVKNLKVQSD
jgi:hypothetical protein